MPNVAQAAMKVREWEDVGGGCGGMSTAYGAVMEGFLGLHEESTNVGQWMIPVIAQVAEGRCGARGKDVGQNTVHLWTPTIGSYRVVEMIYANVQTANKFTHSLRACSAFLAGRPSPSRSQDEKERNPTEVKRKNESKIPCSLQYVQLLA